MINEHILFWIILVNLLLYLKFYKGGLLKWQINL
jgi:hypothetical protein